MKTNRLYFNVNGEVFYIDYEDWLKVTNNTRPSKN